MKSIELRTEAPLAGKLTGIAALKFARRVEADGEHGREVAGLTYLEAASITRVYDAISPKNQAALLALELRTMAVVAGEMLATGESVVKLAILALMGRAKPTRPPGIREHGRYGKPPLCVRKRKAAKATRLADSPTVKVEPPPAPKLLLPSNPIANHATEEAGGFIF